MWCAPNNTYYGDAEFPYNLIPQPKDSKETWSKVEKIIERNTKPTCAQISGYMGNFENVKSFSDKFPEKDYQTYVLEILFIDIDGVDGVLPIFDAYVHWWQRYVDPFLENDPPPEMGKPEKILPLKYLAADVCIKSKINMKNIPKDLKWMLQGMYFRNKKAGERPIVGIKMEIGVSNDPEDPEGAHIFDEAKGAYYTREEQQKYRYSKIQLKDTLFSYAIEVPSGCNVDDAVRDLAKNKIEKAGRMVEGINDSEGIRWGFQSGSAGANRLSNFFVPKPYAKTDRSAVTWEHLKLARNGFEAFAKEMRTSKTNCWKNDKFRISIEVSGPTVQELDLSANDFLRIYQNLTQHKAQEKYFLHCWYSLSFDRKNKDASFNLNTVREVMDASDLCNAMIHFEHKIPKMSKKRMEELKKQINDRIRATPATNPHNPYECIKERFQFQIPPPQPQSTSITGMIKNMLFPPPDETNPLLIDIMHLTERPAEGVYNFSIRLHKYPQVVKGNYKEEWTMSMGCRTCARQFYYRGFPINETSVHLSNLACCLHKSWLLTEKQKNLHNKEVELHSDALMGANIIGCFSQTSQIPDTLKGLVDPDYVQNNILSGFQQDISSKMVFFQQSYLEKLTEPAHFDPILHGYHEQEEEEEQEEEGEEGQEEEEAEGEAA